MISKEKKVARQDLEHHFRLSYRVADDVAILIAETAVEITDFKQRKHAKERNNNMKIKNWR